MPFAYCLSWISPHDIAKLQNNLGIAHFRGDFYLLFFTRYILSAKIWIKCHIMLEF